MSTSASGPEAVLVGIELDRTEAARVAQVHGAAVDERHPEPVPRGIRLVARVEQRIARGFAVDEHPAAHAQVQPEDRAARARVDQDQLPAPSRLRERLAPEARHPPQPA